MNLRLGVVVGLCIGVLALGASYASGGAQSSVACGASVTSDITLTSDLVCSGDGLIVSAGGVTVDLNGYAIIGAGSGVGVNTYLSDGVTIENGSVVGFRIGINVGGTGQSSTVSTLRNLRVVHNSQTGVFAVFGPTLISGNAIAENGVGITTNSSQRLEIVHNTISRNQGDGIFAGRSNSSGLVVSSNRISDNGGFGISVADQGAVIDSNVVIGNGRTGISATETVPEAYPTEYAISNNRADRNGELGIFVTHGLLADAGGNTAKHNGDPRECVNITCGS
jgi:hypothetical protein